MLEDGHPCPRLGVVLQSIVQIDGFLSSYFLKNNTHHKNISIIWFMWAHMNPHHIRIIHIIASMHMYIIMAFHIIMQDRTPHPILVDMIFPIVLDLL